MRSVIGNTVLTLWLAATIITGICGMSNAQQSKNRLDTDTKNQKGIRVIGRVFDRAKKPLPDLRFQLAKCVVENGRMSLIWSSETNDLTAKTDANGRFQFKDVPVGSWAISIPRLGGVGGLVHANGTHVVITVKTGGTRIIDLGDLTSTK